MSVYELNVDFQPNFAGLEGLLLYQQDFQRNENFKKFLT